MILFKKVWIFAPKMDKMHFGKCENLFLFEDELLQCCKWDIFSDFKTLWYCLKKFEFSRQKWAKCTLKNAKIYFSLEMKLFQCCKWDIFSDLKTLWYSLKKFEFSRQKSDSRCDQFPWLIKYICLSRTKWQQNSAEFLLEEVITFRMRCFGNVV